jgi:hypothetical protein
MTRLRARSETHPPCVRERVAAERRSGRSLLVPCERLGAGRGHARIPYMRTHDPATCCSRHRVCGRVAPPGMRRSPYLLGPAIAAANTARSAAAQAQRCGLSAGGTRPSPAPRTEIRLPPLRFLSFSGRLTRQPPWRLSHKPTLGSGASICGRLMLEWPKVPDKWDEAFARAANRVSSPTTQVPKLCGPLCATASMERNSPLRCHVGCWGQTNAADRGRAARLFRREPGSRLVDSIGCA